MLKNSCLARAKGRWREKKTAAAAKRGNNNKNQQEEKKKTREKKTKKVAKNQLWEAESHIPKPK